MSQINLKLIIIACLSFFLSACGETDVSTEKLSSFVYSGNIMGTTFNIKASKPTENISDKELKIIIKTRLDEINQRMSTYVSNSELSLINQSKTQVKQKISPALLKVLTAAKEVNVNSGGAFDVTVAPLVDLWGFGPKASKSEAPKDNEIETLLAQIGDQYYSLGESDITKHKRNLSLDLSALAKGYAVDQAALVLEQQGIKNYLVEIGGELRLKGEKHNNKKWNVSIDKPTVNTKKLQKILSITDIAMATSGDYRNFFEENGVRFSHTIDPRTGRPITHKLASVTVFHESSMYADAWATAMMVLGSKKGFEVAKKEGLPVFFVIKSEEGFTELETPFFTELIRKK